MTDSSELQIDGDLFEALEKVLGREPTEAEPVVILAAYVHSLAKGYGLSDSQRLPESQLGRGDPPAPAKPLIQHFLAEGSFDGEVLRDRLYDIFVALAEDGRARRVLNENAPLSAVGLLKAAQILWNLEATASRPRLPILSGQTITTRGGTVRADIKVPGANDDFATMTWTKRTNHGATGLGAGGAHHSSGQGFRTKGARLAVLAAQHLIAGNSQPVADTEGAVLSRPHPLKRRAAIVWPADEPDLIASSPKPARQDTIAVSLQPEGHPASNTSAPWAGRILVGSPAAVSSAYQRRSFDDEIDRLWSGGGDRRVWLRGGPGLGKSYTARRVMHDAIAQQDVASEELLIWVDSATPQSVREAFSAAVDSMPELGASVATEAQDRVERQSRALLGVLARSTWRWLIVLDNADATALIETGLIPPGGNPNGRVLVTTLSRDHRMAANGRVIAVDLFTPEEAEAYLRAQLDPTSGRASLLARACVTDTTALAATVGYHPLALSVAAATIVTNAMHVDDWITEFQSGAAMDAAADARDGGGYPHLIGATWRLALAKASEGMPDGLVERTAMVAALQDPDGHPTWLWDRDTVTTWVTGGTALSRRHGVPVVVTRLIDHGILELRGNTWRQGTVAIHQLAARAVRELADAEALAALASVLTNEWLLQVTDPEAPAKGSTLHSNIRPITALQALPDLTRQAATALLGYDSPPSLHVVSNLLAPTLEEFAPYLRQGGVLGLTELAGDLLDVALQEQELGLTSRADARFAQAEQIYLQLLDDDSVSDDLRAVHLWRLSELQEVVGRSNEARETRTWAIRLYERLTENDINHGDLESLVVLVRLHERHGDSDRANQLLALVDKYLEHAELAGPATAEPPVADHLASFERGESLRSRAAQLRSLRRDDEAKELLAQAVELFGMVSQHHGLNVYAAFAGRELADIHIGTGHWDAAAECLTQVVASIPTTDNRVLLASVQKRLGRTEEVSTLISAAATLSVDSAKPSESEYPDGWEKFRDLLHKTWEYRLLRLLVRAMERERWNDAAGLAAGLLQIAQQHAEVNPGDHEQDLADAHQMLGKILARLRQLDESTYHLTRSVVIFEMLAELEPDNENLRLELARSLFWLGTTTSLLGRSEDATAQLGRSILLWQELLKHPPADGSAIRGLTDTLSMLATVHRGADRPEEAIDCYLRCAANWQAVADQDVDALGPRRRLGSALWDLGKTYLTLDRPADAVNPLTRSVDAWQTVIQLAPEDHTTLIELARARTGLILSHKALNDTKTALSLASLAVADLQLATREDPDNYEAQSMLANVLSLLSVLYYDRGHLADAEDSIAHAVNISQLLADLAPGEYERTLVLYLRGLAEIQQELGHTENAGAVTARIDDLIRRYPELSE